MHFSGTKQLPLNFAPINPSLRRFSFNSVAHQPAMNRASSVAAAVFAEQDAGSRATYIIYSFAVNTPSCDDGLDLQMQCGVMLPR